MRRIEKYFNDEEDIEKMNIENIFNILYTFEYTEFDLNLFSWSSKIITIEVRNEDYNNKKVYDYIINNYPSAVYRYIAEYNRHNMNYIHFYDFVVKDYNEFDYNNKKEYEIYKRKRNIEKL